MCARQFMLAATGLLRGKPVLLIGLLAENFRGIVS